ncbi:MAG: hypothetical protein RL095_3812 [Verrucomicrobiota bacterium]|jgi:hypothetical protein
MLLEKLFLLKKPPMPGSSEAARQAIYWREIQRHGPLINGFLGIWIGLTFVLPVFGHPVIFFYFLAVYAAAVLVPINLESQRREEELTLCLPPSREDIFNARFNLLLLPVVIMICLGGLSAALDLAARFWDFFVSDTMNQAASKGSSYALFSWGSFAFLGMCLLFRQALCGPGLFTPRGFFSFSLRAGACLLVVFLSCKLSPHFLFISSVFLSLWVMRRGARDFIEQQGGFL